MIRLLLSPALCSLFLLVSPCLNIQAHPLFLRQSPPSTGKRPLPLHRFRWSRLAQQDDDGFYRQAVALCDDYPEESRTEEKVRRDFETMRRVGVTLLRCGIAWESIERAPGEYRWAFWDMLVAMAGRYRITLIPYVCYTPEWLAAKPENFWRQPPRDVRKFGDFVYAIASRYRGKISCWELWNEPDNHEFWEGTVSQFADMVKEGARAVRRADPHATVVLGGMASTSPTPFFQTLQTQFEIERYVDVVNIHGYHETWNNDRMEQYPAQIGATADSLPQADGTPDLWLAEFGYSDYRFAPDRVTRYGVRAYYAYEHTPDYQAVALFKAHVLALSTGRLSLTAWYRINDLKPSQTVIGDDNNKFLGLLTVEGSPKPAFYALRFYNRLFDQPVRCIDRLVTVEKPDASQAEVHCFEKRNGHLVVAAWLRSPKPDEGTDLSGKAEDRRQETLTLVFPQRLGKITCYRENGEALSESAPADGSRLHNLSLFGGKVFIAEIQNEK